MAAETIRLNEHIFHCKQPSHKKKPLPPSPTEKSSPNSYNQKEFIFPDRKCLLKEAFLHLQAFFTTTMNESLKSYFLGPNDFVLSPTFDSIMKKSTATTLLHAQTPSFLEAFLELTSEEIQNLENLLPTWAQPLKKQNAYAKSRAESRMSQYISKISSNFASKMRKAIHSSSYWLPDELQELYKSHSLNAFKEFSNHYAASALLSEGFKILDQVFLKHLEDFRKTVEERNSKFLLECEEEVANLDKAYSDTLELQQNQQEQKQIHLVKELYTEKLQALENFSKIPASFSSQLLEQLGSKLNSTSEMIHQRSYLVKRQSLLWKYKEALKHFYRNENTLFEEIKLREKHKQQKQLTMLEFKALLASLHSSSSSSSSSWSEEERMQDFEQEIDRFFKEILFFNTLHADGMEESIKGYFARAKALYFKLNMKINLACPEESKFKELSQAAKNEVKSLFEFQCKVDLSMSPTQIFQFLQEQECCMHCFPSFQTIPNEDGTLTLKIYGPTLKISKELLFLRKITKPSSSIREVRWMAPKNISIDEDLCGDFWAGKNLVIFTKQVYVIGNERTIDVTGGNGKSACSCKPPSPSNPGCSGCFGKNGEPGESGGNVAIIADKIHNAHNLRIISNGGNGGNGQPGGDGSDGQDGMDGNSRFQTIGSSEQLIKFLPSPAKFLKTRSSQNLLTGKEFLDQLASKEGSVLMEKKAVATIGSRCYKVETREGATICYSFYEGEDNCRSFYTWFQGAHGTRGQEGGRGGDGGRGGSPGYPGSIHLPDEYKGQVCTIQREGLRGKIGAKGIKGKDGKDGEQGTDFAYIDTYVGLTKLTSTSMKQFSGNLSLQIDPEEGEGKEFREGFAYCPYYRKFVTFVPGSGSREGIDGDYDGGETINDDEQEEIALSVRKPEIDVDAILDTIKKCSSTASHSKRC